MARWLSQSDVIQNDIEKEVGFVMVKENEIIGYSAVFINDEPEYANIVGQWLTDKDFVAFHRFAISKSQLRKGLTKVMMKFIEELALDHNIYSIKADTNFDNGAMIHIFETNGYSYCGEVYFRGSPRRAYEKVLNDSIKKNQR